MKSGIKKVIVGDAFFIAFRFKKVKGEKEVWLKE